MKSFDVAVVGGCAAGLAAAISAKRNHPEMSVAVIEKLPRVGKKLLATGNGRCNLTNVNCVSHAYRNADFAAGTFRKYPPESVIDFFASLGLLTYTDSEGRVYPMSNTAASVLDALRMGIEKSGVKIFCDTPVEKIEKTADGFVINSAFRCKKLIVAVGGKASPSQGSDGSGYPLMKSLGHGITPLAPSLVALKADAQVTKSLKGVRIHDCVICVNGISGEIARSRGEILFTDSGLSGIAAMEAGAAVHRALKDGAVYASLDLSPTLSEDDLLQYLKATAKALPDAALDNLLTGIVPKACSVAVCKTAGIYAPDTKLGSLSARQLAAAAKFVKSFTLAVTGTKGYENAQVTSGGVNVGEFDPHTLASKLVDGLYCAGELLDVDGGCGGFNLQWAFASGLLAGELL